MENPNQNKRLVRMNPNMTTPSANQAAGKEVQLGNKTQKLTVSAVTNPENLSFLGSSFEQIAAVLLGATGQDKFPVRLDKKVHMEGLKWAFAASGDAYTPWQQIIESLDKYGIIEINQPG